MLYEVITQEGAHAFVLVGSGEECREGGLPLLVDDLHRLLARRGTLERLPSDIAEEALPRAFLRNNFV